jgi:hypothetical protein
MAAPCVLCSLVRARQTSLSPIAIRLDRTRGGERTGQLSAADRVCARRTPRRQTGQRAWRDGRVRRPRLGGGGTLPVAGGCGAGRAEAVEAALDSGEVHGEGAECQLCTDEVARLLTTAYALRCVCQVSSVVESRSRVVPQIRRADHTNTHAAEHAFITHRKHHSTSPVSLPFSLCHAVRDRRRHSDLAAR